MAEGPLEINFDAIAYRYSTYSTPFWARPNSLPGRWHRLGDGPTQYFSLSSNATWAELIRSWQLSAEEEVRELHVPMWQARVRQARIADYGTFEKAEAAGFEPAALVDDDHQRCQTEGARLRKLGFNGILAPSAALSGEQTLVIFGARRAIQWTTEPRLASTIPAEVTGVGAPPPGLLERVRRHGQPHLGLEAWRRTD